MTDGQRAAAVERLLTAKSVAVIGASDRPGNLGGVALGYLQRFGYRGKVVPVNPGRDMVMGLPCVKSIEDLAEPAELALIAVGATRCAQVVRECGRAGTNVGVIWAGGFSETGSEGAKLQEELKHACEDVGFYALGPNCIGVITSHLGLTATFASFLREESQLLPGNISVVSQSGGLGTMLCAGTQRDGVGVRHVVSTGNEVSLTATDIIDAFVADPGTAVIAAYLEGVRDGRALQEALARARAAGKPVVLLKGGMAPAGARAAAAHTGALAGVGRVWRAVMGELGVTLVDSLEELRETSAALGTEAGRRRPSGNRVALVTFGGGGGVLAADQAIAAGLVPSRLGPDTLKRLRPLVPEIASIDNPVDLTPQAYNDPELAALLPAALQEIAADDTVDSVVAVFGPMAQGEGEVIRAVKELVSTTSKPVWMAWPFGPPGATEALRRFGLYSFEEPAHALRALGQRVRATANVRTPASPASGYSTIWKEVGDRQPTSGVWPEHVAHDLLARAGLTVATGVLARDVEALATAVSTIGGPVAMKAISPAITHREQAGMVRLGVRSQDDARDVFDGMVSRARALGVELEGVYVQQMMYSGEEVLLSAFRDPTFGDMISCGAGGTKAEVVDDVILARGPISPAEAESALMGLRIVRLLVGRGWDLGALAAYMSRLSELGAASPYAEFTLEVNPVKWAPDSVVAVDGLVIAREHEEARSV